MNREEVLMSAKKCVCTDRQSAYGTPENNFSTIAAMWNAYIESIFRARKALAAKDVAAMLGLMKISRIASGNAREDNWVDLAGYAACGGEIEYAEETAKLVDMCAIGALERAGGDVTKAVANEIRSY